MPTENEGIEKGKLFIQAEDGEMKEIGKVDTMQDVIKELNAPIEITQEK